jgi:hypothetical protein
MPLKYLSGEEVRKGDRVLFHGEPGEIEYVVDGFVGDPEIDWHMREHGPGVLIREPKYFGLVYTRGIDDEDLVFVSRAAQ